MRQPPCVIIVMGVAGSGKSTISRLLAEALHWQFHDADDDHSPENIAAMQRGMPLTDAQRQPWVQRLRTRIEQWLEANQPTVLACSALTQRIRATLRGDSDRVCFAYLQGSPELLSQRLSDRQGHFMPAGLLQSQLATLQEPEDAVVLDASQSPAELVQQIRSACGV